MPKNSALWVKVCAISAFLRSDFEGMHHVEADAAPVLLLDDRGGKAELGAADGGDVAAGASAEDDDVVVWHASAYRPRGRAPGRLRPDPAPGGGGLPIGWNARGGENSD
jgi:hypothetical protein